MKSVKILEEAAKVVGGDRQRSHGAPERNFATIARYWGLWLGDRLTGRLTPADVAMMMALLKVSRIQSGTSGFSDHYVDMAGYAALAGELAHQEPLEDDHGDIQEENSGEGE